MQSLSTRPPARVLTPRLALARLGADESRRFHELVTDLHGRCYLADGKVLPLDWASEQAARSAERFERGGLGPWLARRREAPAEPVGSCGFFGGFDPALPVAMIRTLGSEAACG